jgi:ectoine hydroxylase-related dioxygenase (phytanoyl-CoA dioxygenase family)|tara:strand:+ start:1235 stop:1978 length:744 start_codon:yes stop_codon:yes gene_type:complete
MPIDFLNLKTQFDNDGYFVFKNFVKNNFILQLIKEINNSQNTLKYFDKFGNLRRVEKLYDKGKYLIDLNKKISDILRQVFDKEFLIFKDKFNAKPPGGEGFFAHYDGVFQFVNSNNKKKNGWYEYGDFFVSTLIAIDECSKENGALELSKSHKGNFNELLQNTKKDGTPALSTNMESKTLFNLINLNQGDMVVFSNTCPHRSGKNDSLNTRRVIYYTYTPNNNGSKYDEYFKDKVDSKNKSKALSEK